MTPRREQNPREMEATAHASERCQVRLRLPKSVGDFHANDDGGGAMRLADGHERTRSDQGGAGHLLRRYDHPEGLRRLRRGPGQASQPGRESPSML